MKKKLIIMLSIICLIPLPIFAYSDYIIPGGDNVGIEVKNDGVLVIGFYKINNTYNKNNLKVGDVIKRVNNIDVYSIEEMLSKIEELEDNNKVRLTIERNNKEKEMDFQLINEDNKLKTGLYVKDKISGIGTLTYIDPDTKIFGALGHEIIESNTLKKIEVKTGSIFDSKITSIDKSERGNAGTKNATFNYKNTYGTINKNTISGIYGNYTSELPNKDMLKVANPEEIKQGEAKILTVLENNKIEEFTINIMDIDYNNEIKNIHFEITSDELIKKAGGIVQGMSGSPIIQDNKIIGAVTHVIINEPTTGYGIFITTMLEEGEN